MGSSEPSSYMRSNSCVDCKSADFANVHRVMMISGLSAADDFGPIKFVFQEKEAI